MSHRFNGKFSLNLCNTQVFQTKNAEVSCNIPEHLFRVSWQSAQFCENTNNLKEGEIVMALDFSENYMCRYGFEVQPFHWCQQQVTIHPVMLYYADNQGELQKDSLYVSQMTENITIMLCPLLRKRL